MLLSEAIRLGAMLGPQLFGSLAIGSDPGASCAIGSAMLACGCVEYTDEPMAVVDRKKWSAIFPLLAQRDRWCYDASDLRKEIARRNNELHMTREQIADWLVESGNDCSSVEIAPAKDVAAKLISEHMVAK